MNVNYLTMNAVSQELTFDSVQKTFNSNGIEFSEEKHRTLGITNSSDNLYTNLAVLISDQCSHTIKIAVFSDESNTKFKDIKECSGSVFKQLEEVFSYLKLCNNNAAEIDGLKRIDHKDYPDEALREALLNAVVHRDYSFSGSIIININDKEIEFISIGGLLPGLSKEDIKSGISQPRNRNLAEIFQRLHLIESYGTGIRRIYNLYSGYKKQPRIEVTPNTFKIILPNMNNSHSADNIDLSPQKQQIIDYITQNGCISENEIQDIAGVKRTRAYNIAKELCDAGIIKAVGRGKSKK